MSREIAISWLLYAIRETLGLSIVRNKILQEKIQKTGKYQNNVLYYGNTFSSGDTFNDIYRLFDDFEGSDKQILIFTANGEVRKNKLKRSNEMIESHYVSFVAEKSKSKVTIIDPSRKNGKIGIYDPYIGICLEPFFKARGYIVNWLEMSSPCQINYHDVFCQSWTLYLVYKYLTEDKPVVYIPKKQKKKYRKLRLFFKELLQFGLFRRELRVSYQENIRDHENKQLVNYDPCYLLLSIGTNDMYDTDESDYSHKKQKIN